MCLFFFSFCWMRGEAIFFYYSYYCVVVLKISFFLFFFTLVVLAEGYQVIFVVVFDLISRVREICLIFFLGWLLVVCIP